MRRGVSSQSRMAQLDPCSTVGASSEHVASSIDGETVISGVDAGRYFGAVYEADVLRVPGRMIDATVVEVRPATGS